MLDAFSEDEGSPVDSLMESAFALDAVGLPVVVVSLVLGDDEAIDPGEAVFSCSTLDVLSAVDVTFEVGRAEM